MTVINHQHPLNRKLDDCVIVIFICIHMCVCVCVTGPVMTRLHVRRVKEQTCKGFDHFEHYERKESETEINTKIATERDTHNKERENNTCTQN